MDPNDGYDGDGEYDEVYSADGDEQGYDDGADEGGDDLEEVAASAYSDGYGAAQQQQDVDRRLDALERRYPDLAGEEMQEAVINDAFELARRAGGVDPAAMPDLLEMAAKARGLEARGGRGRAASSDPGGPNRAGPRLAEIPVGSVIADA